MHRFLRASLAIHLTAMAALTAACGTTPTTPESNTHEQSPDTVCTPCIGLPPGTCSCLVAPISGGIGCPFASTFDVAYSQPANSSAVYDTGLNGVGGCAYMPVVTGSVSGGDDHVLAYVSTLNNHLMVQMISRGSVPVYANYRFAAISDGSIIYTTVAATAGNPKSTAIATTVPVADTYTVPCGWDGTLNVQPMLGGGYVATHNDGTHVYGDVHGSPTTGTIGYFVTWQHTQTVQHVGPFETGSAPKQISSIPPLFCGYAKLQSASVAITTDPNTLLPTLSAGNSTNIALAGCALPDSQI